MAPIDHFNEIASKEMQNELLNVFEDLYDSNSYQVFRVAELSIQEKSYTVTLESVSSDRDQILFFMNNIINCIPIVKESIINTESIILSLKSSMQIDPAKYDLLLQLCAEYSRFVTVLAFFHSPPPEFSSWLAIVQPIDFDVESIGHNDTFETQIYKLWTEFVDQKLEELKPMGVSSSELSLAAIQLEMDTPASNDKSRRRSSTNSELRKHRYSQNFSFEEISNLNAHKNLGYFKSHNLLGTSRRPSINVNPGSRNFPESELSKSLDDLIEDENESNNHLLFDGVERRGSIRSRKSAELSDTSSIGPDRKMRMGGITFSIPEYDKGGNSSSYSAKSTMVPPLYRKTSHRESFSLTSTTNRLSRLSFHSSRPRLSRGEGRGSFNERLSFSIGTRDSFSIIDSPFNVDDESEIRDLSNFESHMPNVWSYSKSFFDLQEDMKQCVLDYLIKMGYEQAARNFIKEMREENGFCEFADCNDADGDFSMVDIVPDFKCGFFDELTSKIEDWFTIESTESDENEMTMVNHGIHDVGFRKKVSLLILDGKIEEAFNLINIEYPEMFDEFPIVNYRLRHLQLIEMIRTYRLNPHEKKEQFMEKVLEFIKVYLKEPKLLEEKVFVINMEETMFLLCLSDNQKPLPKKLRRLLDKRFRGTVALLVNRAIYSHIHGQETPQPITSSNLASEVRLIALVRVLAWANEKNLSQTATVMIR